MAHNFGGFSSYTDGNIPTVNDGGDGSGVPHRHNVEGLPSLDAMPVEDSLGPTGKRFTEHLHSRKSNGKFEPSSLKSRKKE